jgi:hypothetical protein
MGPLRGRGNIEGRIREWILADGLGIRGCVDHRLIGVDRPRDETSFQVQIRFEPRMTVDQTHRVSADKS